MTEKNVTISVENYGPIAEAKDIELCPLTIFVGPSNTGKSYLAVLIYALFNSIYSRDSFSLFSDGLEKEKKSFSIMRDKQKTKKLKEFLFNLSDKEKEKLNFFDLPEDLQVWVKKGLMQRFEYKFNKELSRCVGSPTGKDPLIGDNFILHCKDRRMSFGLNSNKNTIEITKVPFDTKNSNKVFLEVLNFLKNIILSEDVLSEMFADGFIGLFSRIMYDDFGVIGNYYLPAGRTGIIQSHQVIVGALVKRTTAAGMETVSVPTLSGIVSDFLQEIIFMDTDRKSSASVRKVASGMERNILRGLIQTRKSGINKSPKFFYKQKDFQVPLMRSSSMVSELAPIVLFLKHRIMERDFLIIEEPEAHLHPAAQRQIARTIVDLIRVGVRVMVTTHSEYFLDQISNHVRLSKVNKGKSQTRSLPEKDVSVYTFKDSERGTVVKRLTFDQISGLSPEDHNIVSSDLYNETAKILDKIEDQEK